AGGLSRAGRSVARDGRHETKPGNHLRQLDCLQSGLFDDSHKPVVDGALLEGSQFFSDGSLATTVLFRHRVEDLPATNRDHRGVLPHDEAIAWKRESRLLEPDLRKCGFSWPDPLLSSKTAVP